MLFTVIQTFRVWYKQIQIQIQIIWLHYIEIMPISNSSYGIPTMQIPQICNVILLTHPFILTKKICNTLMLTHHPR